MVWSRRVPMHLRTPIRAGGAPRPNGNTRAAPARSAPVPGARGRSPQRLLHLAEYRFDEHRTRAVKVEADPTCVDRPAHNIIQFLGELGGSQIGVGDANSQDIGERLPGAFLHLLERIPGLSHELVAQLSRNCRSRSWSQSSEFSPAASGRRSSMGIGPARRARW